MRNRRPANQTDEGKQLRSGQLPDRKGSFDHPEVSEPPIFQGGNITDLPMLGLKSVFMFGMFKKRSERECLEEQLKRLQEEAYRLSHSDRTASDRKTAEAHELLLRIEALQKQ